MRSDTQSRAPMLRWLFVVLACGGLFVLGVAAVLAITQCYDICVENSGDWFSRKGAWERWAQLAAAFALFAVLLAAAVAAFRGRIATATTLALIAVAPLVAWIVLLDR